MCFNFCFFDLVVFENLYHNFPMLMLSKDENVGFTKIKERKVILLQNASESIKSSALLIFLREDLLFPF